MLLEDNVIYVSDDKIPMINGIYIHHFMNVHDKYSEWIKPWLKQYAHITRVERIGNSRYPSKRYQSFYDNLKINMEWQHNVRKSREKEDRKNLKKEAKILNQYGILVNMFKDIGMSPKEAAVKANRIIADRTGTNLFNGLGVKVD